MIWHCKHFDFLTPGELYAIIRLRNAVFVVEQHCVFQDADGRDDKCYHLTGVFKDKVVAYARIVPPKVSYKEASIGRFATSRSVRGHGVGKSLMKEAIIQCFVLFGEVNIKIGAQLYLKRFYNSFGFKQIGDEYDEDGIPHIYMLRERGD